LSVVKRAILLAAVAAGFFAYGVIVGHYQIAPFNGIKDLKQKLGFGVELTKWNGLYFPELTRPGSRSPIEVVMLGDSITAGADWAGMFPQVGIVNLGVLGDTSAGVLNRLEDSVDLKPRMVFLMIGVNDIRRKFPIELVEMHVELAAERLMGNGITPVIQSTLYVFDEKVNEKVKALNMMMRAWCAGRSIAYVDLNDVLSADGALLARYTEDGIHLNKEAYRLWGDVVRPYILSAQHAVQ
jgi:lysophospholipase L1-like esterase